MQFRLWVTLFFIFFSVSITHAQDNRRQFNVGMLIGANASSFTERIGEFGADNDYESFIRISPSLGLHARYQLRKMFSLRTELLLNTRGGSYRVESGVISFGNDGKNYYTKNYRLNYFEVPLMGEIDLMANRSSEKLHIRLAVGVSYGLPVASTLRFNGYAPTGSSSGPLVDVDEKFEVVSVGHANSPVFNSLAELSFDFLSGNDTPLFVRIRYCGSLNEVYDQDEIDGYNFSTIMSTWSLAFGFYFMKH
jgi:hypothetical protein